MPFNSLNLNLNKQFKNNTSLTLRVRNFLMMKRKVYLRDMEELLNILDIEI